jgi:uncharacterized membrane protein YgcG
MVSVLRAAAAALVLLATVAAPLRAQERVLSFYAELTVLPDGAVEVVEAVSVVTDGTRRGFFRDLPTRGTVWPGLHRFEEFRVLRVERAGRPEPHAVEETDHGVRIRVGDAGVVLPAGRHDYVLAYRTTPRLLFRADEDELFWNVTGNGWPIPIERASYALRLPPPAAVTAHASFTGPPGARIRDVETLERTREVFRVASTRTLAPGEGLSVAAAWPAGAVARPTAGREIGRAVRDNPGFVLGVLLTLAALGYFAVAWARVGRDPKGAPPAPRPEPPPGVSPVAAGFLLHRGFAEPFTTDRALSVALTSLAVKGVVSMDETPDGFAISKGRYDPAALPVGERAVVEALFPAGGGDRVEFGKGYVPALGAARSALAAAYGREHAHALFRSNLRYLLRGGAIALAAHLSFLAVDAAGPDGAFLGAVLAVFMLLAALPVFFALDQGMKRWTAAGPALGDRVARTWWIAALFPLCFLFPAGLMAVLSQFLPPLTLMLAPIPLLSVVVAWPLLQAPTRLGRDLLDGVEGYRLWLDAGGGAASLPPDQLQRHYERHLPYAMALGRETRWTDRLSAGVSASGTDPQTAAALARERERTERDREMDRALDRAWRSRWASAAAAASLAPASSPSSSSSGLSGGSSGGGSGGGGGGLW